MMNNNKSNQQHIALIGPTYPFKGGISQCSSFFFQHLRKRVSAEMHTFKSLYPSWLFPGKSEPDPSSYIVTIPDAIRDLAFLDPFSFYRLGKRLRHKTTHVVVAWWTIAWVPHLWLLLKGLKRKSRVIFWCLNVVDHENRPIKQMMTKFILRRVDYFLVDNDQDHQQLLKWVPRANVAISPLPVYMFAKNDPNCQQPSEKKKPSDVKRILFFGFIRSYKGVSDLVDALPQVLKFFPAELTIAGECWGNTKAEITSRIERLQIGNHIIFLGRYMPNEEVPKLFADSDLIVLPYRKGAGSGIVNLAIEMERPMVVTDVGALPSSVIPGKTGFVARASDPASLAEKIIQALQTSFDPEDLARARKERSTAWENFMTALESLF